VKLVHLVGFNTKKPLICV